MKTRKITPEETKKANQNFKLKMNKNGYKWRGLYADDDLWSKLQNITQKYKDKHKYYDLLERRKYTRYL